MDVALPVILLVDGRSTSCVALLLVDGRSTSCDTICVALSVILLVDGRDGVVQLLLNKFSVCPNFAELID